MKSIVLKIFAGLVFVLIALIAAVQIKFGMDQSKIYSAKEFSIKEEVAKASVDLGRRMYTVRNGCIDCHGADLSGAKIMDDGAMGSIHGANITPYALSQWTDEQVARAIRYGIHKTGRSLRFMPSIDFEGLSLGDVAALVAYLRSVPAVEKPSHENSFGPVARALSAAGQMPVMFPAKGIDLNRGFEEKPAEGPTFPFGKYLARSCVGCHGGEFRGGKIPGGDPAWPAASNIRLGSNPVWTEASFRETIKSGLSPVSKQMLRAPMPIALLAQLNDDETKALWEFLSSLK